MTGAARGAHSNSLWKSTDLLTTQLAPPVRNQQEEGGRRGVAPRNSLLKLKFKFPMGRDCEGKFGSAVLVLGNAAGTRRCCA